jgi:hypothetical protein
MLLKELFSVLKGKAVDLTQSCYVYIYTTNPPQFETLFQETWLQSLARMGHVIPILSSDQNLLFIAYMHSISMFSSTYPSSPGGNMEFAKQTCAQHPYAHLTRNWA